MQVDKIDIKIMKELYKDYVMPPRDAYVRRSFRSIAKSVQIDQHAIRNRIRKLQEQGVIRRWYIAVNPTLFGLRMAALQIFLHDNSDKDGIMQRISSSFSENMALLCNHLEQKLIVILYYKNTKDLDSDIDKLMKITNAIFVNKLPKFFTECRAKLTRSDWKIISSLQQDPWKPYSAISKELRISPKTVKRRIEALAKEGAVYLLVDMNMKSVEGIVPADLLIFYENRDNNINSTLKDRTRLQIAEYLGDQLLFSEPNFNPDMDHFALILSNISKSQEIQKWAGGKEGVKQAYASILLDVFPQYKLYKELVEDRIRQQQRQSTEFVGAKV
ncbi:MAG TPA: AsnC family transcriptional regulator [Nitrososphaeraceae archaeon]|nr:AsnC family transcriptional regulator [Nitrososphaeraceae archaeon]